MIRTAFASTLRLSLLIVALLAMAGCDRDARWHLHDITGFMPDLVFTLSDANTGAQVTAQAFRDKIVLLYFGYTHCPDVCPTTLAKLASAVTSLGQSGRSVQVLFVTVDPRRDTRAVLRRYTRAFGPEFVGLRGTQEQLMTLAKRYRVTYSYGKPDPKGNYEVDHSSAVFIFDRAGHARLLADPTDGVKAIESDLRRLLKQS